MRQSLLDEWMPSSNSNSRKSKPGQPKPRIRPGLMIEEGEALFVVPTRRFGKIKEGYR